MNSSADIRRAFLEFFRDRGHEVVASSPLVPANDPTLLFTNAGMVQFKDVFLGREQRTYRRATTSQRCVRAGGKHNDLENVGYTARHHTFFEMLGNFSFGDYFKRDAIVFAWEFLTREVGLPRDKLWVTVFEEDDEAAEIWLREIGVDAERFARIGATDNFWSMGDTGPCGPCTEVFYDHGPGVAGGPPGTPEADGDRYIEIWNLVFMQYDRGADGTLNPLPAPSVDTGMGLERLAAVLQGVHSNYEIDLFQALISAAAEVTGAEDRSSPSLKVVADHIRSSSFLITDGVLPSNEGRGYVLRRIMRRAIRHGYKLGCSTPFLHRLVAPLEAQMGEAYPELTRMAASVERSIRQEEERFSETLEQGMRILEETLSGLSGTVIPGDTVFRLYDTFGFPVDLTGDIARERNLTLDMAGFEAAMQKQRERARAASHFAADYGRAVALEGTTEFTGYHRTDDEATVAALYRNGESVQALTAGDAGVVVLEHTPFYAESGGQVGDTGILEAESGQFQVEDTRKQGGEAYAHLGKLLAGSLKVGQRVAAKVDGERRIATALNHSATHLLHVALRQNLGEHVTQKGSLVAPDRLRFDFSHFEPVSNAQLRRIERLVNAQIRRNDAVDVRVMAMDDAVEAGALALFGEKYGDQVRVLRMGDFSTELCGGTHVSRTGDIGFFKIVGESGVASGVRRIEAVTGEGALSWSENAESTLRDVARLVKGDPDNVEEKVRQLFERSRKLERETEQLRARLASGQGTDLAASAVDVNGIKVVAARIDGADAKALREAVDQLKSKLGSAAIVLAAVDESGQVRLVAGVTKDRLAQLKAGELVNVVAQRVGGRGGGRPDLAQAGGNDPSGLEEALRAVPDWVSSQLGLEAGTPAR
jgi:alanyl-tRNA synthetase